MNNKSFESKHPFLTIQWDFIETKPDTNSSLFVPWTGTKTTEHNCYSSSSNLELEQIKLDTTLKITTTKLRTMTKQTTNHKATTQTTKKTQALKLSFN